MSDPVLTYDSRYQLDESGVSPNNLVQNELHSLAHDRNRAAAPLYGPFFAEGLVVTETSTGRLLTKGTHYSLVGLANMPSQRTGKAVFQVILITDPNVLPNITVNYQAIGGEYTFSAETLVEMINTALVALPGGSYYDIIDLPDDLEPVQHLHPVGSPKGFEYVTYILERIQQAILAGQMPAYRQLLNLIEQQYNNSDARFTALMEQLYESAVTNLSGNATIPTYPIGGTQIDTYCVGTTLMGKYNDGNGSFYNAPIAMQSVSCGFIPSVPVGTLLNTYCVGTIRMGTYSNGQGGTYDAVIEVNSITCGYTGATGDLNVVLGVTSAAFNVGASRTITATLKGLQPSTQYKVFLTALHASGLVGSFESNGAFSYETPTAPSLYPVAGPTVSAANTPSMTVTTDGSGNGLATLSFTNRGNMPQGNWTISAELVYGTTNTPALKVQQVGINVPAGQPSIALSAGFDSKTVRYDVANFPANGNFSAKLNWIRGTGELAIYDLSFSTDSAGSATGNVTNANSGLYFHAWMSSATSGAPDSIISPIYTPNPDTILGGGAEAPGVIMTTKARYYVGIVGQTMEVYYMVTGLEPNIEYMVTPLVEIGIGADPVPVQLPGGGGDLTSSWYSDFNGFVLIRALITWDSSWAAGEYTFQGRLQRVSDLHVINPDILHYERLTYMDLAGTSTIGLRMKTGVAFAQPTDIDYFDKNTPEYVKTAAPGVAELQLLYANLIPSTHYTGYLVTPAGNVPIDFITPEDTGVDGGGDNGVCAISPVLVQYSTDAYGSTGDTSDLQFIVQLTSHGLTSNVLHIDATLQPDADISATPGDIADGATMHFEATMTQLTPFGEYMAQIVLVNPYAQELVFPVLDKVQITADVNGSFTLSQDFVAQVGINVLVGVYSPRVRVISAAFATSRPDAYTDFTDGAQPGKEVSVRSATTFIDISGFLSDQPPAN